MKILFLPEVVDQFLNLAEVLYEGGYHGFKDAAIAYSEQHIFLNQAQLYPGQGKREFRLGSFAGIPVRIEI